MRIRWYKLAEDGQTPVPLPEGVYPKDMDEWRDPHRTVGSTQITPDIRVSTVFLCLDHSYAPDGEPILWETMVFGGPHDGWQSRYTSYADAKEGHEWVVAMVKGDGCENINSPS